MLSVTADAALGIPFTEGPRSHHQALQPAGICLLQYLTVTIILSPDIFHFLEQNR